MSASSLDFVPSLEMYLKTMQNMIPCEFALQPA